MFFVVSNLYDESNRLVRQRENFLVLMNNYNKVLEAQGIAANSAGLAEERYAIYLDSVEAASNRVTASWEKMWQTTLDSGVIKFLLNVQAAVFNLIDSLGGLIPVVATLLGYVALFNVSKIAGGIDTIIAAIGGLKASVIEFSIASGTALVVSTAGIALIIGALAAMVISISKATQTTRNFAEEIDKLNSSIASETSSIDSLEKLIKEYDSLATKVNKSVEEEQRWVDVQNQIRNVAPDVMGYYDQMGDFIVTNTENLKALVAIKKENLELDKAEKEKVILESLESKLKVYEETEKKLEELQISYSQYLRWKKLAEETPDLYAEMQAKEGTLPGLTLIVETLAALDKDLTPLTADIKKQLLSLAQDFYSLTDSGQAMMEMAIKAIPVYGEALFAAIQGFKKSAEETTAESVLAFSGQMNAIYESMSGRNRDAFWGLANDIAFLGDSFKEGKLQAKEYFELLNSDLANVDFAKMFGTDEKGMAAAQTFFASLTAEVSGNLTNLNDKFNEGKISVADYTEQISYIGDTYQELNNMLIENADSLGMDEEAVKSFKAALASSSESIDQAQEQLSILQSTNELLFATWSSLGSGAIQQGSDDYTEALKQISVEAYNSMTAVGAALTDANGKVLESSDAVFQYMSQGLGNFENISDQVANKTGSTVETITSGIANVLNALATDISNFKMSLSIDTSKLTLTDIGIGGLKLPSGSIEITGSMGNSFANTSAALKTLAQTIAKQDTSKWTADIYRYGDAADSAAKSLNNLGSAQSKVNDAQEAYDDLLQEVIKMLKQKKEDEKKALEEELEGYKKIIDARKKIIEQEREEEKYKDSLSEKNKEIAEIQNELLQMQYDTSEEANARRLTLQEQLAEKQKDLANIQADHEVDVRTDALDDEYERFKEITDEKIAVIDDYLSKTGAITAEAIALLNEHSMALYQSLIDWNRLYGSGIDEDITSKWDLATQAFQRYADAVGSGGGGGSTSTSKTPNQSDYAANIIKGAMEWGIGGGGGGNKPMTMFHSGGWVEGVPSLETNEVYAKLMKGEFVSTPEMINTLIGKTLPNFAASIAGGNTISSEVNFYVTGNMDKSIVPEIKQMVFEAINNAMRQKGKITNAFNYSV